MTARGRQFGRVPTAFATGGWAQVLSRAELAVYVILAVHVRGASWTAHPGITRMVALTGLGERTVQRALAGLADRGLIEIVRGGGRQRTNRYTLVVDLLESDAKPRHLGDTVSAEKPRHSCDTLSPEKPHQSKAETPSKLTVNPVTAVTPKQTEQRKNKRPAASGCREVVQYFCERWAALVGGGAPYRFNDGRDGKAVKTIVEATANDASRVCAMIDAYLADSDPWLIERAPERPLSILASSARLNRYLVATANKPSAPQPPDATCEHPLIRDARKRGWGDDVDAHGQWWAGFVKAVELGRWVANVVKSARDVDAEAFRARIDLEGKRHAVG